MYVLYEEFVQHDCVLSQVQSLQKKMHAALNIYYKLRGLYNRAELSRMESESTENTRKVCSFNVSILFSRQPRS